MEIILQLIFFSVCAIIAIIFIIFFRKYDKEVDYNKWVDIYRKEKEKTLLKISFGNKKIDQIEHKILSCKKKLKINK